MVRGKCFMLYGSSSLTLGFLNIFPKQMKERRVMTKIAPVIKKSGLWNAGRMQRENWTLETGYWNEVC